MEKSNKRGKIPQTDWPLIMARYEAGETLASIARTYDCSAPAISYIVSRNRDKSANELRTPGVAEPQLIKVHTNESAAPDGQPEVVSPVVQPAVKLSREAEPQVSMPAAAASPRQERERALGSAGAPVGGVPRSAMPSPGNGEARPRLHLALGNGGGVGQAGNGHGNARPESQPIGDRAGYPQGQPSPQYADVAERPSANPFAGPPRGSAPFDRGRNGRDLFALEGRPAAQAPREDGEGQRRKDGGAFIDQELRTRVDGDIAAFLAAFDAALAADTHESRFGLREATDRLLRAGARTRIELERLEARVPLAQRDGGAVETPAWRHR